MFASSSAASPISPELSMRKRTAGSRLVSAPGGERLVIMWREARGRAGLAIEGRFHLASEKAPDAILKNCLRHQAATAAESIEPAHPGGHMTDLVVIDPPQDRGALRITDALELSDHSRRHIEPARLEHERHDGKSGEQVAGSCRGRFPLPVVSRQIAIFRSESAQAPVQQFEMLGFFRSYLNPIGEKCARSRFAAEPRYEVPGEIDRVELDMREGMEQRDTSRRRAERPPFRHLLGWPKERSRRPRRPLWGRRTSDLQRAHPPLFGQPATGRHLRRRLGGLEDRDRPTAKCVAFCQSARAALRTSATWPGTRTLRHAPRTMPFRSIRKVERSIPIYLRPYMLFSTQVPYFSQTSEPASEARANGRLRFFFNLSCEATGSFEIPITTASAPP